MDRSPSDGSSSAHIHRSKLDEQFTELSQPFLASLPFNVCVVENDTVTHLDDVSDVELQSVDIAHYPNC